MVEMALILGDAWYDNQVEGGDVLIRVEVPDQRVVLFCMGDEAKQVVVTFEELEAIRKLVKESRQEFGDPEPKDETSSPSAAQ